jgi:hypothetical protein
MSGTFQGKATSIANPATIIERDSNANSAVNAIIENTATIVSSAGTTTLTVSSAPIQILTGTQAQTFVLPNATTLATNQSYKFINNSTGSIALQTNGAASLSTIKSDSVLEVFCISNATAAGTWATTPVASGILLGNAPQILTGTIIDWSAGNTFTKTLSASTTFTFSNASPGQTILVRITNTASNFTSTFPTSKWSGGSQPVQSPGAVTDIWSFWYDGTSYWGTVIQNMS